MASPASKIAVVASALTENVREAPRLAGRMGFRGLVFSAVSSSFDLTELTETGRREFRRMLSSQSLDLVALRGDVGNKGFSLGADVDRALAGLDRALETARGLGTPVVCVDLGPLPPAPAVAKPRPKVTPDMAGLILLPNALAAPAPDVTSLQHVPAAVDPNFYAQVDAAMLDLGQRADRYGVMVAFSSELSSFASIDRALRKANCPWFGIDLDPVAVLRDEWSLDEVFSALGTQVRHVRGRDALAGADRRTKAAVVGRGDTDWRELLARLNEAGYSGWITVDPMELPERIAAADAARQWIAKAR